jgi:hypothetical protein
MVIAESRSLLHQGFTAIFVRRLALALPSNEVKPIGGMIEAKGIAERGIGGLTGEVRLFVKKQ